MACCNHDPKRFFTRAMSLFFGIWLLYIGLTKWLVMGHAGFSAYIAGQFDKTWSPHGLNVALAYFIMSAEPLLGLLLLSGIKPRLAWSLTALLMFVLMMGQTIIQSKDVIMNWQYTVLTLACAALSAPMEQTPGARS